jgi:nucleotide-binding universal stress UspA family protein
MLCVRAPHVLHCRYWRGRKASASTEIDGAKIDDARWAALRKGWMREQGYDPDTGDAADAAPDDDDEDVRLMRQMEEEEERRQEEERIAFLAERAKKQQAAESAKAKASSRIPASPFCNHAPRARVRLFSSSSPKHFDLLVLTFRPTLVVHWLRVQAAADAAEGGGGSGASDNGDDNQNFSEDEGDWFADMQAQEEAEAARQEQERLEWEAKKKAAAAKT